MLYIKDGYPEVGEIVSCIVTKIYGNTTFVTLNEYEKEGVLTISEIAPGRIRNLRDHVVENKLIICKVLRVDQKDRRVDVSLRRVSIPLMKKKLEEIKKEEYSDRIYQEVSKELNITKDDLFEKTYEPIFEEYELVFEALYDIMLNNEKIKMFKDLDAKSQEIFLNAINNRIKPEEVVLKNKFSLKSTKSNGVEEVKSIIKAALETLNYDKVNVSYIAAGEFEIKISHDDIKSADILYNKFTTFVEKESKANKLEFKITSKSNKN